MLQYRANEEIVKRELSNLFDKSISLRALYLLNRRREFVRAPFSSEDLAQFLIRLLVYNFRDVADMPAIPEIILKFLTGDLEGSKNAVAASLKATFFDNKTIASEFTWDEFYYLHLLPDKKLFHLTSAREKIYAASLCAKKLSERKLIPQISSTEEKKTDGPSCIFDYQTKESILKFASMHNAAVPISRPFSVTICGFHRAMMGLGEDARRIFDVLTELGFRVELFDCSPSSLEGDPTLSFYEMFETNLPCSEVVIFCMPLFEMARILPSLSERFFSTRYIIGYWPWELPRFPVGWTAIMDLADEIWASSNFLVEVYRKASARPVHRVPLCVDIGCDRDDEIASEFIHPGITTFLTVFDFNSSIYRKNPIGSIRAFKAAFAERSYDARLVLKGIHGRLNDEHLQLVLAEIDGDPRITLIDGPISRPSLNGLIAASSALLSLHRSEGFGRLLAEAMILRTPVIATGWSGSCDYINEQTAFPIDFQLREVAPVEYPYASGNWAEPNLEHAAQVMRLLADDKLTCASLVDAAFSFVNSNFSISKIKSAVLERMENISDVLANSGRT